MVESSAKTSLVIDLSPGGRGQTAKIAGRISLDGRPVEGAQVQVYGSGANASATTDAYGDYETGDFLCQSGVQVRINGPVKTASGETEQMDFFSDQVTPLPQSTHRLDLDLHSRSLKVHVVSGAAATPVPDAAVGIQLSGSRGNGQSALTDAEGMAELTILSSGKHTVTAGAEGYADASKEVDLGDGGHTGTVEFELLASVMCAGVADLNTFGLSTANGAYMRIQGEHDSNWDRLDADDLADDNRAAFSVDGLQPGHYEAQLWCDGEMSAPYEFDLREGGDANLLFVFERASDDN